MALAVLILALVVLGLGLAQVWTIWMLKREIARLEHRLGEALDDEDLVEFQDRLQGLLSQVREAGLDAVESVDRRQQALEEVLQRARALEMQIEDQMALPRPAAAVSRKKLPAARSSRELAAKAALSRLAHAARPKAPREPQASTGSDSEDAVVRKTLAGRSNPIPARNQRVYDLADQGLSREQIAKAGGVLPGEVDLILNLRRQKPRS